MKLDRYNQKRDFTLTAEPSGELRPTTAGHSYVIQKHDATRLHYDFRLELDGVLLSWAVPKGPSLDPKQKRLAVRTEDHPVDYRDFEGNIPHGEYGGGPVIVWDRGSWEEIGDPRAGLKKGRLDFAVHGEKLHGKFSLVRMKPRSEKDAKKENWLLFKRDDEHVRLGEESEIVDRLPESVISGRTVGQVEKGVTRMAKKKAAKHGGAQRKPRATMPDAPEPQLATLVDAVPEGAEWIYEIKYDGYRILATKAGDHVELLSRNGKDWTDAFPEVAEALSRVRATNAVFDGEVAYVDDQGKTDFQHLQNALKSNRRDRLVYFVFDLLHFDGDDLRPQSVVERKNVLRGVLAGEALPLKFGDHIEGDGQALFDHACQHGLEGIIAKRGDRAYVSGRTKDWVKVKCQLRQELVIAGYTYPKGHRSGLGALLLAVKKDGALRYAGKVGTGFTQKSLDDLSLRLGKLEIEEPAIEGVPRMKDARWVEPKLVCQVRFTEWTRDGALRHPAFEGLREDKQAADVVREEPVHAPAPRKKNVRGVETEEVAGIPISHPDRVIDEASGATKIELARYYDAVSEVMIPYVAKRPIMLVRCPDGAGPSCFHQKHAGRGLSASIEERAAGDEKVLVATKPSQIVELAQWGTIELHGWGSVMPKWQHPDWIVLDLDPDEALPFSRVADAALAMRDSLKTLGLESFVKTTGGKGLHVVVPLSPVATWAIVAAFSARIAEAFASHAPGQYVATMAKAARKGKIFVDHFRNGRGATAVLPYSARARPHLGVALPIAWKDVSSVDPNELTIRTVPGILAKRRTDPWADLLATKQVISADVIEAIRV